MIRNVRTAIVVMALACLSACQFDPDVELNGAQVVSQGQCASNSRVYVCFGIEKDGKKYFVGMDNEGPFAVWSVKDWKRDYTEDEIKLVWERDNKKRRKNEV